MSVAFTILAVSPLYFSHIVDGYDYSIDLNCDDITPQSNVIPLQGNSGRQWLGILTSCTVTNLDRHTVKITGIRATATPNQTGPLFTFTPERSDGAFDAIPELRNQTLPVSVAPRAINNFYGLFVLPLADDWNDGSPACRRLNSVAERNLWRASACLSMLRTDRLADYIVGLRTPSPGDSTHDPVGYRDFSVQVRFDNGEADSVSLRLSPGFEQRSHTFQRESSE